MTISPKKRMITILSIIVFLLFIPLIAMQFSNDVDWSIFDFIIIGILLLATGIGCEIVFRKVKSTLYKLLICGVIILAFILLWAELAVGIFNSPIAGS